MAARADTVEAIPVKQKITVKKKKKTIYLTFDDGPNKGTRNVMNIIKDQQVAATMFLVGEHVYGSRGQHDLFDSLRLNPCLELANHSHTHGYGNNYGKYYSMPDSVVSDFRRCADSLDLTGNIARTPGRNIWRIRGMSHTDISSSAAAADSLYSNGFVLVGWDLEWHYNTELETMQTVEELTTQLDSMFAKNKTKTSDHLVILAHDQVYSDVGDSSRLQRFVTTIKEKGGYDFAFIKEYPGINNTGQPDSVVTKK
jgi:peptidoglycan/xylan/chitin deacetylase (PgdA/CDA1 family)